MKPSDVVFAHAEDEVAGGGLFAHLVEEPHEEEFVGGEEEEAAGEDGVQQQGGGEVLAAEFAVVQLGGEGGQGVFELADLGLRGLREGCCGRG